MGELIRGNIARLIRGGIAQRMFPGAVAYVSLRGEVLFHEAFGTTTYDPATARAVRLDDLFDLASLTKLYTTAVALQLADRGFLALDEPVRHYVTEVTAEWTVEDLLAHRTGTTADLLGEALRRGIRPCEPGQEKPLWDVICQCKAAVALGEGQSHYSDVDFLLLQAACERATGSTMAELAMAAIIAPLGLGETCFRPPDPARCVPTEVDECWRHRLLVGEVHDEIAATLGGVAGHAGLFATARDVGRFCESWLSHNCGRGWSRAAFAPRSDNFGLGWRLCNASFFPSLERYGAVGHLGFTGTSAILLPRSGTVFVLLTNRVHPRRDAAPSRLPLIARLAEALAEAV